MLEHWRNALAAGRHTLRVVADADASNGAAGDLDYLDFALEAADPPAAAAVRWVVTDHLGTPRMVIDQTGSLAGVSRHDYLPFGEELRAGAAGRTAGRGYAADGVRHKFTGYERDPETGLDFAQNRYYFPTQGRFTSVDPENTGANEGDPQSWNGYAYAGSNPLKYIDPLGLWKRVECSGGATQCWEAEEGDTYETLAKEIGTWYPNMLAEFFSNQEITPGQVFDASGYSDWWQRQMAHQIAERYADGPPVMSGGLRIPSGGARSGGGLFSRFWNWLRGGGGSRGSTFAGGVTREALERAAADPGPTVQVVTKLTRAPQAGRPLSVAAGENAGALANAARGGGQVYTANIPKALIETLRTARLVEQRVTRMGGTSAVEYRFRPEAAEFIIRFFR
ncbi:MAG: RHS repeat-associated core domain-containing protein [Acidobacteriota bacterium]|nr:RHS repeat-associated core domain-containing protein [Acidobacteriota bacterium]